MTDFRLPDLGEGLPDAEIVKWHVAEGDSMVEGDLMAEMSTAKAVVEIPAPYTGKIVKLAGIPGDTINTGDVLVVFQVGDEVVDLGAETAAKPTAVAEEASVPAEEPTGEGVEVFRLPDLGEGLQDAEIVKWHCAVGDSVTQDELMVEMSTAKAVVEVPAPYTGTIITQAGQPGDVINTGEMLAEISTISASGGGTDKPADNGARADSGTVVGAVVIGTEIKSEATTSKDGIKASPAVRATARKLKVGLASVTGSGTGGEVTLGDVKKASENPSSAAPAVKSAPVVSAELPKDILVSPSAKAAAAALGLDVACAFPQDGRKTITKGDVFAAAKAQLQNGGGTGAPAQANARASNVKISDGRGVPATPKVRAHAKDQGVDIRKVSPTGHAGNVTMDDVNAALKADFTAIMPVEGDYAFPTRTLPASGQPERMVGPRKVMSQAMAKANAEVCHTSLFEEANIGSWPKGTDITVRTMRAIVAACMVEPALNAHYNHDSFEKTTMPNVNLGVAVDSPKGLFVPVIKGMETMEGPDMRAELNRLREAIGSNKITAKEMSGATITLSNFGMLAGKFATPIITPPQVAIIGIGGLFKQLVMTENGIENLRHMPLSLTFDHRGCTGGEAARFLAAIRDDLQLMY
jgi:pyruvate dehydrogenase E2 component (dihydrolipoamide acetyltransferase)